MPSSRGSRIARLEGLIDFERSARPSLPSRTARPRSERSGAPDPSQDAAKLPMVWSPIRSDDLLRRSEEVDPGVVFEIEGRVLLRVPEGDRGGLLRPLPLRRWVRRVDLGRVPAILIDQEDVLGLRQQLELGDGVFPPRGLATRQRAAAFRSSDCRDPSRTCGPRRYRDSSGRRPFACTRSSGRAATSTSAPAAVWSSVHSCSPSGSRTWTKTE